MYTEVQLEQYFRHIGFSNVDDTNTLTRLAELQKRHLARVPFENITLHYSKHRRLSLDQDDLFQKIVHDSRGGYCMEVNTFFATILRSLGYTLISAGGRVRAPDGLTGWSHMVNIVTIDGQRYWVDVGFGSSCSIQPIPLQSGVEFDCILPMRGKLEYRSIAEHSDPNQRLWVYSSQEDANAPWKEMYTFIDVEFFASDFEVMNLSTMTSPRSFFVKTVLAMRMILSEETGKLEGVLILHKDYVKRRLGETTELLEDLTSEEQRVLALERYFQIVLNSSEQKAIWGLATELISQGTGAMRM